jgi:hypothetical protein
VVTGSKDFYKDGHDYVTPRLRLVGCSLRVRGASLAGRGVYPPGTLTETNYHWIHDDVFGKALDVLSALFFATDS